MSGVDIGAVVSALQQAVAVLEMLCDSANPATADEVTDAQLAAAVNKAIEDGNAILMQAGVTHGP